MPNLVDIVIGAKDETGPAIGSALSAFKNLGSGAALGIAGVGAAVGGLVGAAYAIGSNFDEASDKIRVGTGATGTALEGLNSDFKAVVQDVPTDFGHASDAITKLHQELGLSGPPLQDLSKQLLNLSHVTKTDLNENIQNSTTLFKNWQVGAEDQGDTLDLLFRASQKSGIGIGELTSQVGDNGVKLRALGFDLMDSVALFGSLHKAGIDASSVMPAFSKAMATAAKEGKNAHQVLNETFDRIKQAPTDTAAASAAMEVFGAKAGPQMAAAVREGKLSIQDMVDAIDGGGDTINAAAADTEDFAEKWQKFANKLQVAVEPIATRVFNAVGTAMDALGPKINQLAGWLSENLPKAIDAIGAKWDEWGPKITDAITVVADKAGEFKDKLIELGQVVANNQGALIGLAIVAGAIALAIAGVEAPIIGVIALIAAIGAGIVWLWNNFDTFHDVITNVFGYITTNAPVVWNAITSGIATVVGWLQPLIGYITANSEAFANIGKILLVVAGILVGIVVAAILAMIAACALAVAAVVVVGLALAALIAVLYNLIQTIWDVFNNIRGALGQGIDHIEEFIQFVWDMVNNVATAFANVVRAVWLGIQVFWDLVQNVANAISTAGAWLWSLVGKANDMANGFGNAIQSAINWVLSLPGRILSALGDLGSLLWDSGARMIQGLINGFMSKVGEVRDKVSGALQSIRNLFPFSPAKEGPFSGTGWVSYSGAAIARDFAASIAAGTGGVRDAAGRLMNAASLKGSASFGATGAAGLGGTSHVHNWYVQGSIRSDRDLIKLVADEFINKGFAG